MYAYIRNRCLFLYLLLCFQYNYAQLVDVKNCNGGNRYFITRQVEVLKTSNRISLDSVLAAYQGQFSEIKKKEVVFSGYDSFYYWFRFTVHNSDTVAKDLILVLGPLGVKDAQLFSEQNGSWRSIGKTGVQYEFIKRSYQYAHYAFPIRIEASSVTNFYMSMDFGHEYRSYAFVLMESRAFKKLENRFYFLSGIIIGLLSLFFALNLYLYFSVKERIQLWYSVYNLALILIVMTNDELTSQFFGLDSENRYKLLPLSAVGAVAIAVLTHVVQLFLSNINKTQIIYRATAFAKYNLLASGVAHFLAFNLAPGIPTEAAVFTWVNLSTTVCVIAIFINCFYSIYHRFQTAWFIVVGLGLFLVGGLQRLLQVSTPSYVFPPSLFHIGMILETTVVSFGLIYRHRLERKETIRQMKQKEQLKTAQEKQLLESKIDAQEKMFKELSQEIHDNIGQLLILAKMNLASAEMNQSDYKHKISESEDFLDLALKDLGSLSNAFQIDSATRLTLVESITAELELIKKTAGYKITFSVNGTSFESDRRVEISLFRVFQEVLNNIMKHAQADQVDVNLDFDGNRIIMKITDNGKGFLVPTTDEADAYQGLGLRNMDNRVKQIGGTLKIESNVGEGTSITVSVGQYQM